MNRRWVPSPPADAPPDCGILNLPTCRGSLQGALRPVICANTALPEPVIRLLPNPASPAIRGLGDAGTKPLGTGCKSLHSKSVRVCSKA